MKNFSQFEPNPLYSIVNFTREHIRPVYSSLNLWKYYLKHPMNPFRDAMYNHYISANVEFMQHLVKEHTKPEFGINDIELTDGKKVIVKQYICERKTFCNLVRFEKDCAKQGPKMLIVAPISGHFSTLLRGTVKDLLPHFDVYITDWVDAKEVPLDKGGFDLDDQIDYVMDFIRYLGPDCHVMAVCQPVVPVLAAAAIMADKEPKAAPGSIILIGGPVDARKNPTMVNTFATENPMFMFEYMLVSRVPYSFPGSMRPVYPGFLQLLSFVWMNIEKHAGAHFRFFENLVKGDGDSAEAHLAFYNEYLSVMDVTAEFYLQTIDVVFKKFSLPLGNMVSRGRYVDPKKITRTRLLVLEGENDDISGIGQTKAAMDLCSSLKDSQKLYHLQPDVGHYGIFNGSRFRKFVVPVIKKFTYNDKGGKK